LRANFPPLKEASAWSLVGDNIRADPRRQRQTALRIHRSRSGTYESLRPGQPLTFLQSAAALGPPPATAEQMTGDWSVVRGASAPICTLTLAMTATAASKDEFALKVQPGCDAVVVGFGPVSWHMENGELVLKSARRPDLAL
jgi:hypothetical protein